MFCLSPFPGKTPLHLVMDNYGTHSTVEVKSWLKAHPRFNTHFVPTSCAEPDRALVR
jgi:hypothetical protein